MNWRMLGTGSDPTSFDPRPSKTGSLGLRRSYELPSARWIMVTTAPPSVASALLASPNGATKNDLPGGLTSDEARRRLAKFGPNAMPDTSLHSFRMALEKFRAPAPWMLEAAIVLELVLGKYIEAAIIAGLLVFNAALGLFQESRAQATLAALKSRMALNASVWRDGAWQTVPAVGLVPGDVVKLSLGGVVAADVRLTSGEILLDQSMLIGESIPIEAGVGIETYAGALVRRGEAVAKPARLERAPSLAAPQSSSAPPMW
jgi:H+-transporting ATPase